MKAQDLVEAFHIPLNEKGGYIWGAAGQTWTEAKQKAATRPMTVKYGSKWIGHKVWDCSGMFVWAYKRFGESIYHGSNTIWKKYCSSKGELKNGARADGEPIKPGTAVFLYRKSDNCRHHIGLYVGNNMVIEAKGTINGVVMSRLSHWDEWGELLAVDYSGVEGDKPVQILKKGSRGDAVVYLQEMLNSLGYDCGTADGVYGNRTADAVRAFQRDNGLTDDGVAGEKTMTLIAAKCAKPDDPEDDDSLSGDQPAPGLPEDDDDHDMHLITVMVSYDDALKLISLCQEAVRILEKAIS